MYLAIAYSYPPENGAMSPVTSNILNYIPDCGYIITKDKLYSKQKNKEAKLIAKYPIDNPYKRISTRIAQKVGSSPVPDILNYWAKKAMKIAEDIAQRETIDHIISFSFPHSSHLIARKISLRNNYIWIAYMADPLVNGLMYERSGSFRRKRIEKLEKNIVTNANIVLTNSTVYRHQLGKEKVKLLYHGYTEYTEHKEGIKNQIAHFGNIYGARSIRRWSACAEIVREVNHVNYGTVGSEERGLAEQSGIVLRKPLGYNEFLSEIRRSLGLVVICGDTYGSGLSFPSKVIEYIGADRPVFVFAPRNSAIGAFAEKAGIQLMSLDSEWKMKKQYRRLVNSITGANANYEIRSKLSPETTCERVKAIYDEI